MAGNPDPEREHLGLHLSLSEDSTRLEARVIHSRLKEFTRLRF